VDRFHLAGDVIDRVPSLGSRAAHAKQFIRDKLLDHKNYIRTHGEDMPEISNWRWGRAQPGERTPKRRQSGQRGIRKGPGKKIR